MAENILKTKSFKFAVKIVNLCKHLCEDKKEIVLLKQILLSGTSVGVNIIEAEHSESKADFIQKLTIAQKKVNETIYWLELMCEIEPLSDIEFKSIKNDAVELLKILTSSIKTAKQSLTINS